MNQILFTPTSIIPVRTSCRSFLEEPLSRKEWQDVKERFDSLPPAPFGTVPRYALLGAGDDMKNEKLKLGTYGFVSHPSAFITAVVKRGDMVMEDLGFLLEYLVLYATSMGLGSCWLGGSFNRGRFGTIMKIKPKEFIPAVIALGHPATERTLRDRMIRFTAKSGKHRQWETVFFDGEWDNPLPVENAGPWAEPLEMVRIGPSASNHQPWRIIRTDENTFHLFLHRTPGYRERNRLMFGMEDIQRLDMGVAMCHFQLTAAEKDLSGSWVRSPDTGIIPPEGAGYVATWKVSG